jgi:hypothetical protein
MRSKLRPRQRGRSGGEVRATRPAGGTLMDHPGGRTPGAPASTARVTERRDGELVVRAARVLGSRGVPVTCAQCREEVLEAEQIGDEEECALRDHLLAVHPNTLQPETLGMLLWHFVVSEPPPVA